MKRTILPLAFLFASLASYAQRASDTSSIITFAIIGDYGSNDSNEANVARMVDSWDPEFIVTVGDNSYDDDRSDNLDRNVGKYYGKYIYNPANPKVKSDPAGKAFAQKRNLFFPCMGNHDGKNEESFTNYLHYFGVPKNYSFAWGRCKFHFFYSGPHGHGNGNGEFDDETKAYIHSTLDHQRRSDSFNLAFFHHPPHCSTIMGNPKISGAFDFDTMNVDAVICGHEHLYERITHVAPDSRPLYVVCGTGGADLSTADEINRTGPGAGLVSRHLDYQHFGAIKVTLISDMRGSMLYFEYYTVDSHGPHLADKYFLQK